MTEMEFATYLAEGAGKIALRIRQEVESETLTLSPGISLDKYADSATQAWIEQQFQKYNITDAVLSEEAPDDLSRLSSNKLWIIDPLDGSEAFARGSKDFAIHVGLWEKNKPLLGAVNLPAYGKLFFTTKENSHKLPTHYKNVLVKSTTRDFPLVHKLAETLNIKIEKRSSAGFKAMQLALGNASIYMHEGLMNEWDTCAPVAVAESYGLFCSDFEGNELQYNKIPPLTKQLLICRPELKDRVLQIINTN